MAGKRKIHGGAFKAQVALAAHKGDRTVNELAGHYGVHATLIHAWKKQLLTGAAGIFESTAKAASAEAEARQSELFEQIGRLKMELEWVKKKGSSVFKCKMGQKELSDPGPSGGSARSTNRSPPMPDSSPGSGGPIDCRPTSARTPAW
jgi:transposase